MKLKAVVILLVVAMFMLGSQVIASSGDQPIEWEGNPGGWRWSLSYRGQGFQISGDKCDWNDHVFSINMNGSADPDKFRIFSSDSTVAKAFSGKSPIGHDLIGTSAYICLGYRNTRSAGGPGNVASNLFVWVK